MKVCAPFLVLGIATVFSSPAAAEEEKSPITLTLAPYGWVPTVDGTASLGPLTVPAHVTPKDFAAGIKIGGMGYVRLETKREFIYAETIVADYDNPRFRPFFSQSLKTHVRFFEAGIGINRSIPLGERGVIRISPYIGMHNLHIESFVSGDLINTPANGNWTNPVAGVTFELPVKGRFTLVGKIDAAGFGITQTNYRNATVLIDYRISNRVHLDLGYRRAHGNFSSANGLAINVRGSGPMLALRYSVPIRR